MIGHNDAGLVLGQVLLAAQLPAQADQRGDAMAPSASPSEIIKMKHYTENQLNI